MAATDNPYSGQISPEAPSSEVDAATLSGASLSTDGTLSGDSDTLIPSQKAVKTYADALDTRVDKYEAYLPIDGSGNVTFTQKFGHGCVPSRKIEICSETDTTADATIMAVARTDSVAPYACGYMLLGKTRGSEATPDYLALNDFLGVLAFTGWSGSADTGYAGILSRATEAHSSGNNGSNLEFYITNDGASLTSKAMTIEQDGTVSVGTSNYETLVTADDDVPNKKYVDDAIDTDVAVVAGLFPSGMISQFAGTSDPTGWLICDGDTLGNASSGATHASDSYQALFDVVKSGWGNAGTEVFANGDTVNIPDLRGAFLRGTGSHGSETMADGNAFAGPAIGSSENDQSQGHKHDVGTDIYIPGTTGYDPNWVEHSGSSLGAASERSTGPVSDGTNGTPRSGDETRPFNYGINYIIKI